MQHKIRLLFKEWILPFGLLALVLVLVNYFLFFFVWVPTGSMIPTILDHSVLFATRVHQPEKSLERGDVVVFQSDELGELLVKRLVGLPGEEIRIDDMGDLYIDGQPLAEPYVKNISPKSGSFQVPEGCYFFLGDNRSGSYDARGWKNPYISEDKIKGKAVFTIWPFAKLGPMK